MIQHIMLWNYREEASAEEREAPPGLAGRATVPGALSFERAVGACLWGTNQSFSHCFVMYFHDRKGLSEYDNPPQSCSLLHGLQGGVRYAGSDRLRGTKP